jgi:hypothetical protein
MADFRAITAVTEGVLQLLRTSYDPEDFNQELEFKVYTARDFSNPISAGVSLFLSRVMPCGVQRTPAGPVQTDGRAAGTLLPVDLRFMLTVWGGEASLQHLIVGWMMRVLEDHPILPAGVLNTVVPASFDPNETVELSLAELSNEDLLRMWDTLVQNVYQLSVPYIARVVRIEPIRRRAQGGGLVQERVLAAAALETAQERRR